MKKNTKEPLHLTKVIRIDPQVDQFLMRNVQGFENRNQVLRRLLGIDKPQRPGPQT